MTRLWLSLIALGTGAGLLIAAAIDVSSGTAAETRRGGTLRVSVPVDIDVDPALAYDTVAWSLEFPTCAKLFNYPDAAGAAGTRVIREVVERWGVSRDGKTYIFDLKRSFRFHTGAPVTARSFALAFNRNANPKMKSPAVPYLREIVGANAVLAGKARTISGVRVLGRYRLRIRLTRPLGDFIARLTMPFFCPILPNTPIDPAGIDDPPGSGPYYVAERIPNRRIVLRRNPFYRGGRPANVDQMVVMIGESGAPCQLATEQDRIDLCIGNNWFLGDATFRRIVEQYGINRPGGRFFVNPSSGTWYFAFNHDRRAFRGRGQIALKKAINHALDRPALARAFGYLGARRTDQMLPPALGRDVSIYPIRGADPVTARKLLARARFKPAGLVLYTYNSRRGIEFGQLFKFNLRQIGIDVEVKHFEQAALNERASRRGEPYDVALSAWAADYLDGASFFEPLLSGRSRWKPGHFNYSYFDDARTAARMEAASRLTGAARRRAGAELDFDLMRNNPPWAPFIHEVYRGFVSQSFGCYLFHPVYLVDLAAACKK